ncbi:hypothetical protein BS47DRAFT_1344466 [Hydnum rufescens UP504]|uniref:Casein kinase II subunit beta n=1 Tax=Hydnum rufescens UP504 TaxID=1448309 RepID=A0A9P6AXM0_9AGAM|nr:hypothetical protein BS47DRAFT_1344466 [Hydnum rufescens UP504]
MSHSVAYSTSDPTLVDMPEEEEIAELPEGDDDEAMIEEAAEDQGYASSTPTSSLTWITWFCSLPGHEYFCEVTEDFIVDDFNLTGLNALVPFWKEAMEMVLDVEPEDALKIPDVSIVESSAELLYGWCTNDTFSRDLVEKYEAGHFGVCPRVYCQSCPVAPSGRSDLPGLETVKLYCPNCNDIYTPPSSRYQGVDGAFFGTTFAPLLFQTFRELSPAPFCPAHPAPSVRGSPRSSSNNSPTGGAAGSNDDAVSFVNPNPHGGKKRPAGKVYVPTLFGFRVSEKARSGPRMAWLRLRPETAEELDAVDWRGQWKEDAGGDDDEDEDEDTDGRGGPMENFDDGLDEEEEDDEEEEEEEEAAPPPPPPAAAPTRKGGRGKVASVLLTDDWADSRIRSNPSHCDETASSTSFDTAIEYDPTEEPSNFSPSFPGPDKTRLDLKPRIALGKRTGSDWASIVSLPLIQP